MLKVGIVTFHDADNMGAVLQAYGLQRTLDALGHMACFINFSKSQKPRSPLSGSGPLMGRLLEAEARRHAAFEDFRSRYLNITDYSATSPDEYDLFVAGSDQVWNPALTGGDSRFLLTFAPPEKRCSYAASFGSDTLPAADADRMAPELKKFRHLSLREKSGASLVLQLTGRHGTTDVDPALLPEVSEWEGMMEPSADTAPYLLLIMVAGDLALFRAAKELARERGLAVKTVSASYFPAAGMEAWSGATVPSWLRLIRDAQLVVTSSFHGTVFSLQFRKEFFTAPLVGALAGRNTRVSELLSVLGCGDRVLGRPCEPLDWDSIADRITQMKKASIEHLSAMLADYEGEAPSE